MGHVRHGVALVVAVVTIVASAATAMSDGHGGVGSTTTGDGAKTTAMLSRDRLGDLARENAGPGGPVFEYASVANCPGAAPGVAGSDALCGQAVAACAGNSVEQGLGPSVILLRRPVLGGVVSGPWVRVGITCFPEFVPGRATPGMAMIVQAFHDTDFAVPRPVVQPVGGRTLVNLATFVAVDFPQAGFGPGEVDRVDPTRMLGFAVEIRPRVHGVTYHFGDGTAYGPTTSLGGPFPTGDVTHTYRAPGTYSVRVDITYAGQFRIGGGPWLDIPGTVIVTGVEVPLEVAEARAHLVNG